MAVRFLDASRSSRHRDRERFQTTLEELAAHHETELKGFKVRHAHEVSYLRGIERTTRVRCEERVQKAEDEYTQIESTIRSLERKLRQTSTESRAEAEALHSEVDRLRQGRTWSAVEAERARVSKLEAELR